MNLTKKKKIYIYMSEQLSEDIGLNEKVPCNWSEFMEIRLLHGNFRRGFS